MDLASNFTCICPHCQRDTKVSLGLTKRITYCKNVRRYHCEWRDCVHVSHTRQDLERHRSTHSANRPYKCQSCGTAYKRSDSLTRHMKSKICKDTAANNDNRELVRSQAFEVPSSETGDTGVVDSANIVNALQYLKSYNRPINDTRTAYSPLRQHFDPSRRALPSWNGDETKTVDTLFDRRIPSEHPRGRPISSSAGFGQPTGRTEIAQEHSATRPHALRSVPLTSDCVDPSRIKPSRSGAYEESPHSMLPVIERQVWFGSESAAAPALAYSPHEADTGPFTAKSDYDNLPSHHAGLWTNPVPATQGLELPCLLNDMGSFYHTDLSSGLVPVPPQASSYEEEIIQEWVKMYENPSYGAPWS